MNNQGEGEEGEKEEEGKEGKQKKIPDPVPRKNFGDWAEKQRKKKEAEEARKKQEEEIRKSQQEAANPQQLKTPDQMVEEGLSGTGEKTLAIPKEEFALMTVEDEKQIVLEALGQAVEEYVYCYKKAGKLISGVSVTGAKDLAREVGDVELLLPVNCHLEQGPDGEMYWHAGVRARHMRKNVIMLGFGRQWTKRKLQVKDPRTGEWTGEYQIIEDSYSWNTAIGKAQRNALLSCLPSSTIKAYIEKHMPEIAKKKGIW